MTPTDVVTGARIAHVGVAVRDLDDAVRFYRDILGAHVHPPQAADGARIVGVSLGDSDVELLTSDDADSPIGRFLAKRGPGIHHVCFRVPDLAAALEQCRRAGYQLLDQQPRPGADGHRVAFVHPKATAGILLELTD